MPLTRSPAGIALTTSLQTIITNPVGSGERWTVQIRFPNIDGVNNATVSACNWIDANNGNLALAILPVNAKCDKQDGVAVQKVIDPGDSIQASASANGDIVAVPDVTFIEPAT